VTFYNEDHTKNNRKAVEEVEIADSAFPQVSWGLVSIWGCGGVFYSLVLSLREYKTSSSSLADMADMATYFFVLRHL
jgi:hypothetical protein